MRNASVGAARDTIAAAGGLEVLVNNAGILGSTGAIAETTVDDLREVYETNVFGIVRVSKAFLPLLAESEAPVVVVSPGMGSLGRTTDPERIESTIIVRAAQFGPDGPTGAYLDREGTLPW